MARNGVFEFDLSQFKKALQKVPHVVGVGAKRGLDDVKDDWKREAVDIAPLDKSNLRKQITGKTEMNGPLDGFVELTASASQDTGDKRFNYAYYIHEMDAGGRQLRTPGTEKEFLDKPAEKNEAKWVGWIEEEIRDELKKAGW